MSRCSRRIILETALSSIHRADSAAAIYKIYSPQVRLKVSPILKRGREVGREGESRRNGLELKCCFAPEETLCILFSGAFASLYLSAPRPSTQLTLSHSLSVPQISARAPGWNETPRPRAAPPQDSRQPIGRPTGAPTTWLPVIFKFIWDFSGNCEQFFKNSPCQEEEGFQRQRETMAKRSTFFYTKFLNIVFKCNNFLGIFR